MHPKNKLQFHPSILPVLKLTMRMKEGKNIFHLMLFFLVQIVFIIESKENPQGPNGEQVANICWNGHLPWIKYINSLKSCIYRFSDIYLGLYFHSIVPMAKDFTVKSYLLLFCWFNNTFMQSQGHMALKN